MTQLVSAIGETIFEFLHNKPFGQIWHRYNLCARLWYNTLYQICEQYGIVYVHNSGIRQILENRIMQKKVPYLFSERRTHHCINNWIESAGTLGKHSW